MWMRNFSLLSIEKKNPFQIILMLRDFYRPAAWPISEACCNAYVLTLETSHLTALLSHEGDVNRKAADSSKINIRRSEIQGLGHIDRKCTTEG